MLPQILNSNEHNRITGSNRHGLSPALTDALQDLGSATSLDSERPACREQCGKGGESALVHGFVQTFVGVFSGFEVLDCIIYHMSQNDIILQIAATPSHRSLYQGKPKLRS